MATTGVMRPGHIQLRVLDIDETVEFYKNVLGLVETGRDPQGRVYFKARDERDHKHTEVRLVYGIHVRIILTSVGEKFRSGIEDHCDINLIHSGHQVLHEKHAEELLESL